MRIMHGARDGGNESSGTLRGKWFLFLCKTAAFSQFHRENGQSTVPSRFGFVVRQRALRNPPIIFGNWTKAGL